MVGYHSTYKQKTFQISSQKLKEGKGKGNKKVNKKFMIENMTVTIKCPTSSEITALLESSRK